MSMARSLIFIGFVIQMLLIIIFDALYEAVCFQFTNFGGDDCGNRCILFPTIIIQWENEPLAIVYG